MTSITFRPDKITNIAQQREIFIDRVWGLYRDATLKKKRSGLSGRLMHSKTTDEDLWKKILNSTSDAALMQSWRIDPAIDTARGLITMAKAIQKSDVPEVRVHEDTWENLTKPLFNVKFHPDADMTAREWVQSGIQKYPQALSAKMI